MIQFNLLPDIKIQYLRARRQKHLVLLGSVGVIIVSVAVLAILIFVVFGLQKKNLSDLGKDIKTNSDQLENTPNLSKMLTVQNQLRSLPSMHDKKAVVSRLFGFVSQVTPANVSISRLDSDFTKSTLVVSGAADSLETVNTFTDSLKFSTYHTASSPQQEVPAFSNVVLATFGRDSKGASYTINMSFDPVIFSETDDVTLTVPKKVTTRSETEQPSALFKAQTGQQ